jgi:hypothetical protein
MKKLFLALLVILAVCEIKAQSVGIGTNNPSGKFHISNSLSGSDALFFVDTTGNVGVGTLKPQNKLDVAGGILAQSARILSYSPTDQPLRVEHSLSLIDQQQDVGDDDYGVFTPGWQSFTAGISGTLESVSLKFNFGMFFPRGLKIFSGEGVSGIELASLSVQAPPALGGMTTSHLNVPVIAGNKYTIWLSDQAFWRTSASDVYTGGRSDIAVYDHVFKTYVRSSLSRLTVENNGNIGIGTDSATEKLVVETTTDNYGLIHTNGSIIVGTYVGGSSIYGGWIGTKSNHPLMFFTNNGSPQLTLLQNGNIGIGTVTPAYKLQVSGAVAAAGFVNMSDARLKKDIVPLSDALSKVLQLNGVSYYWNRESYPQFQFDTNHKIGFLAQEVEKIMPELVATGADGYKTVNYIEVVPLLVESIKDQERRIDQQQKLNESLKTRLEKLEKILAGK